MERLRKTAEWLPPRSEPEDTIDNYRREHFPVLSVSEQETKTTPQALEIGHQMLLQLAEYKGVQPNQIWTAYDIDYVLRSPTRQLSSLCPGKIPDNSIQTLKKYQKMGLTIGAIVTNQPLKGHQVARIVGRVKGYSSMERILEGNFSKTEIISANHKWSFVWQRSKDSPKNVDHLAEMIKASKAQLFAFFGDRYDVDAEFWANIQRQVPEKDSQFAFVKLPNPTGSSDFLTTILPLLP